MTRGSRVEGRKGEKDDSYKGNQCGREDGRESCR